MLLNHEDDVLLLIMSENNYQF